jgi:hypothetical protein
MIHTRHSLSALSMSVAVCALLLSGCSANDSSSSVAAGNPTPSESTSAPTEPTSEPTSSAPTSTPPATVAFTFSPRSGGKHLEDCQRLVPGDDPAEFLYYPVLVKTPTAVTLDSVETEHTQGVTDAAAWLAPAGSTPETGTFKGWPPPKIVTADPNLQWSKRVPAAGATIDPATGFYNVFIRLQVDPTPGDSAVTGITFAYHDPAGSHTVTWVARTTFSMSC